MSAKLIVVANYPRAEEAHVARLQLEHEGVLAFVQEEDEWVQAPRWPAGGVKVLVPEDQVEAATRILGIADN